MDSVSSEFYRDEFFFVLLNNPQTIDRHQAHKPLAIEKSQRKFVGNPREKPRR